MIQHVLVFRFRDDVDEAERDRLLDEMRTFPSHFPAMRNFHLGRNESSAPAQDVSVILAPVGQPFRTDLAPQANPACGF